MAQSSINHQLTPQSLGMSLAKMNQINEKYKTELCRHYQNRGQCALVDRCHFAHGDVELRKVGDALSAEQYQMAAKAIQH